MLTKIVVCVMAGCQQTTNVQKTTNLQATKLTVGVTTEVSASGKKHSLIIPIVCRFLKLYIKVRQ